MLITSNHNVTHSQETKLRRISAFFVRKHSIENLLKDVFSAGKVMDWVYDLLFSAATAYLNL